MSYDNPWGWIQSLDCHACDKDKIQDAAHIAAFTKELVNRIDMVAYGEPQIVNFGTGNKAGYTLVQLIETSNICAHFCNDTGDAYFDIFSCKAFEPAVVEATINEYFSPDNIRWSMSARYTNPPRDIANQEPSVRVTDNLGNPINTDQTDGLNFINT